MLVWQQPGISGYNCVDSDSAGTDKYVLILYTPLKDVKMQIAKKFKGNSLCMQQNKPVFGFFPIYWLGSRVSDGKQVSVYTDILQLHEELKYDGRHNYKGI